MDYFDSMPFKDVDHLDEETADDAFEIDQERRFLKLIAFIDDFINADEIQERLRLKEAIVKVDKSTEITDPLQLERKETVENAFKDAQNARYNHDFEQYPLTGKSLITRAKERRRQLKSQADEALVVHKKRTEAMDRLRQKLSSDYDKFKCHSTIRNEFKSIGENKRFLAACREFGLNPAYISHKNRDKVICCYKRKMVTTEDQEERNKLILLKLLSERERQREIDRERSKTYDYKVKRKERIVKDMVVDGVQMVLHSPEATDEPEEKVDDDVPEVVEPDEVETIMKVKVKDKKAKGKKDAKDKKVDKKKAKAKDKKKNAKKDKGKKTKKVAVQEDILKIPRAPITNPRSRIKGDYERTTVELIERMEELKDINEENRRYEEDSKRFDEIVVPLDEEFVWTPRIVKFSNYKNDRIYKRKIRVKYVGRDWKKCRFFRCKLKEEEIDDPTIVQVEPFDVQVDRTGIDFAVTVTFDPTAAAARPTEGLITFVTYNHKETVGCRHFNVPLIFEPYCPRVSLKPTKLDFGSVPNWRTKNAVQSIRIKNTSDLPLIVCMRSINDPFEIDRSSYEDSIDEDSRTWFGTTIDRCLENVTSRFELDAYFVEIQPRGIATLRVRLKSTASTAIGHLVESFQLNVYDSSTDDVVNFVGGLPLYAEATITDRFVRVEPDVVDLGVCTVDAVRTFRIDVGNDDTRMQRIAIKIPPLFSDYFACETRELYVQACDRRTVPLKFAPRRDILGKLRNHRVDSSVLQVPIYLRLVAKDYADAPPMKVRVFVALSDPRSLTVAQSTGLIESHCHDGLLLNFGACNVTETTTATITLTNGSLASQEYGFLDLPDYVAIAPDYGFGMIRPSETRSLTVAFSPDARDLPLQMMAVSVYELMKRITLSTVKEVGGVKESRAKKQSNDDEKRQIVANEGDCTCVDRSQCFYEFLTQNEDDSSAREDEEVPNAIAIDRNRLYLTGRLVRPCCDFDYHQIKFPDTPCGSYSTAHVVLSFKANETIGCECGYLTRLYRGKKPCENAIANFRIYGTSDQFAIEPSCGRLHSVDEITLTVIVKPEVPDYLVREKAEDIKRLKIVERKRAEWKTKQEKLMAIKRAKLEQKLMKSKKTKKEKKGSEKKEKQRDDAPNAIEIEPEPEPTFEAAADEIVLDHLDFCPAEMAVWRDFAEYGIDALFTCVVRYETDDICTVREDRIRLKAMCNVVKPDFVHNLELQHVDFGAVAVGDRSRKIIALQNINTESDIQPSIFPLSPIGPFFCPPTFNCTLQPEYLLDVPVTFRPTDCSQYVEYFEVTAGRTVCPLIVSGEGVAAEIAINPDFLVCRLEGSVGGITSCTLELNNKSSATVNMNITKICELEGKILTKEIASSPRKDKKGNKLEKKKKEQKKPKKYSKDLTADEVYSLENHFDVKDGESYFDVVPANGDLRLEPHSKRTVQVRFGLPSVIKEIDERKLSKGKKDKTKKAHKKSKGSKKSKNTKRMEPEQYYIAKFNMIIGSDTFIKDFIIIAKF